MDNMNIDPILGKVDITPIFWNLLNNIVKYDHNILIETDEYKKMNEYIFNDSIFVLCLGPITIETDDINELFHEAELFYREYNMYSDEHLLIKDALVRIYQYVEIEDTIDHLFDKFNI